MNKPRRAEERARQLLESYGVQHPPIDLESLAKAENITVVFQELEDEISGMLVMNGNETVIGINVKHHPNRQRFTLAHELAHFYLHELNPTVFVDGMMVHFQSEIAERPPAPEEVEANAFAATLLMPADFLARDLQDRPIDAFDEVAVRQIAQKYKVSPQALTIRLMELGLLRGFPRTALKGA